MPARQRRVVRLFPRAFVAPALAVWVSSSGCGGEAATAPTPDPPDAAAPSEVPADYDPRESLAPMIEAVGPAVVRIEAVGAKNPFGLGTTGTGSGFVLTRDGLVVTNHHVCGGASEIVVHLADGRRFEADIVGSDPQTDLALLRLDGGSDLPTATLGESAGLRIGDWVVAVGNPLGLEHSATVGIISGKGRGSLGLYEDSFVDFLQTDADIAPGSSGGPLFDLHGRVVGITTAVGAAHQPGFAIPVDQARRVIEQLRESGHVARGWLGATNVPGEHDPDGARVGEVVADSPAARAGLRPGDVITHVEGERIRGFNELRGRVATTKPGTELSLRVRRGDGSEELSVQLAERPEGEALTRLLPAAPPAPRAPAEPPASGRHPIERFLMPFAEDPEAPADARLGIGAREATDGIDVVSVESGGLAERIGLQKGDRITSVNGEDVRHPEDVRRALAGNTGNVKIRFQRAGTSHEVSFERS